MPSKIKLAAAACAVLLTMSCSTDSTSDTTIKKTTTTTAASPSTTAATTTGDTKKPTTATADEYTTALAASFTNTGFGTGEIVLDDNAADCVATTWVDILDPSRLNAAGITAADFGDAAGNIEFGTLNVTEADAGKMFDTFANCDVDIYTSFADALATQSGVDETASACIVDAIDDGILREIMVVGISGDPAELEGDSDLNTRFTAALTSCMPTS